MKVFRAWISRSSTSRMYLIGFPPHICRLGTTRPGGTTEFGVIIQPFYSTLPSIMTEFAPMKTSLPIRLEYIVHPGCTATLLSIVKEAGKPLGTLAAVKSTQFSPMFIFSAKLIELISPRSTAPPQIHTLSPKVICPTSVAFGAMKLLKCW